MYAGILIGVHVRKHGFQRHLKELRYLDKMGGRNPYRAKLIIGNLVSRYAQNRRQLILTESACCA